MSAYQLAMTTVGLLAAALGLPPTGNQTVAQESDSSPTTSQASAKDIFFQPVQPGGLLRPRLAIWYKILIQHGGDVRPVREDRTFKSGDRFRIVFQANVNGYMYLLHKGSTGTGRFLFPDVRINGGGNEVTAHCEHIVPATGWFEFDENRGAETIHVILSSEPLPELLRLGGHDEIPAHRWRQVVDVLVMGYERLLAGRRSKDIVYVEPGQDTSIPAAGRPGRVGNVSFAATAEQSNGSTDGPTRANAAPTVSTGDEPESSATSPLSSASARAQQSDAPKPASGAAQQPGDCTAQTFVAQAEAPAGDGNLLVHTVHLKHE